VATKKAEKTKTISLPIPLDLWFKDAKKIDELRTILESETIQTAIATLKEIAGPTNGGIVSGMHGTQAIVMLSMIFIN
jgi:hypothetical protein